MIIALATVSGFQNGIREKIIGINGHIIVDNISNVEGGIPASFSQSFESYTKAIRNTKGVTRADLVLIRPCIIHGGEEIDGMVAKGVDNDYQFGFLKENLIAGQIPDFKKDSAQALVSSTTARRLNLKVGDKLQAIFFRENMDGPKSARAIVPRIAGIFSTGLEDFDKTLIITHRSLLRRMVERNNSFSQWEIGLENYKKAPEISYQIAQKLKAGVFRVNPVQKYNRQVFDWLGLLDTNVVIILVLMILVACINMSTTLLILITERTQMVGILKAVGAANRKIRQIFIFQALFIAFVGLLIGNVIGLGFCYIQDRYQPIKLNVETYYVNHVLVDLEPWHIPAVNIGTMLICFLVLFLPSMVISRLTPVKTMRFQ